MNENANQSWVCTLSDSSPISVFLVLHSIHFFAQDLEASTSAVWKFEILLRPVDNRGLCSVFYNESHLAFHCTVCCWIALQTETLLDITYHIVSYFQCQSHIWLWHWKYGVIYSEVKEGQGEVVDMIVSCWWRLEDFCIYAYICISKQSAERATQWIDN